MPSGDHTGPNESPLPEADPAVLTDTRVVVPATKSRTNTSRPVSVSSGSRSDASLKKATLVPSGDHTGLNELPLPEAVPAVLTDTRVVVPATTSRTNTSRPVSVSSGSRSDAKLLKATLVPSGDHTGLNELPLPEADPAVLTETSPPSTTPLANPSSNL